MRFSKAVVKYRIPILILTVFLMIPAVIGIANTRINYDMLNYLREDMDRGASSDPENAPPAPILQLFLGFLGFVPTAAIMA